MSAQMPLVPTFLRYTQILLGGISRLSAPDPPVLWDVPDGKGGVIHLEFVRKLGAGGFGMAALVMDGDTTLVLKMSDSDSFFEVEVAALIYVREVMMDQGWGPHFARMIHAWTYTPTNSVSPEWDSFFDAYANGNVTRTRTGPFGFILMEYLNGGDLSRQHIFKGLDVTSLAFQAVWGLEELHSCGMVHRDISLRNMGLTKYPGMRTDAFWEDALTGRTYNALQKQSRRGPWLLKYIDMGSAVSLPSAMWNFRYDWPVTQFFSRPPESFFLPKKPIPSLQYTFASDVWSLGWVLITMSGLVASTQEQLSDNVGDIPHFVLLEAKAVISSIPEHSLARRFIHIAGGVREGIMIVRRLHYLIKQLGVPPSTAFGGIEKTWMWDAIVKHMPPGQPGELVEYIRRTGNPVYALFLRMVAWDPHDRPTASELLASDAWNTLLAATTQDGDVFTRPARVRSHPKGMHLAKGLSEKHVRPKRSLANRGHDIIYEPAGAPAIPPEVYEQLTRILQRTPTAYSPTPTVADDSI